MGTDPRLMVLPKVKWGRLGEAYSNITATLKLLGVPSRMLGVLGNCLVVHQRGNLKS